MARRQFIDRGRYLLGRHLVAPGEHARPGEQPAWMMLGEAGRNPPGKNGVSRLAGSPGCGLAVLHGALVRLGVGRV
jgi:hypothetical protein